MSKLRKLCVAAIAGSLVFFTATTRPTSQGVTVPFEDQTYIMPVWEHAAFSPTEAAAEFQKLKDAIGPEGPYAKLGFTVYVPVKMETFDVTAANVRANLKEAIGHIDGHIATAKAANVPICLSILNETREGYDALQLGAENADVRNTQWLGKNGDAKDNTLSKGWMTSSRYARVYRAKLELYVRELGKILAERIAANPTLLICAAGPGEVEFSTQEAPGDIQAKLLADYSPFAIAEFRDWLTATGLYAAGNTFGGQGYANAARYGGASAVGLAQFNADFGTSFTTWSLKYRDWQLSNEAGSAIGISEYNAGLNLQTIAGGFDAPRDLTVPRSNSSYWQIWMQFRRVMLNNNIKEWAQWITTTDSSSSMATNNLVPTSRWYSYQIPSDYLFGRTPDNPFNFRYETSGSSWDTGDITPYGRVGITAFNVSNPACRDTNPLVDGWCRTLVGVAPQIGARNRHFGIFEGHPAVGDQAPASPNTGIPAGTDPYGEEMKIIQRWRPSVYSPYPLYTAETGAARKPFYNSGFIAALKAEMAKLNLGPGANTPDMRLVIDTPVDGLTVAPSTPFNITGYAVDLGTVLGSGFGTGVSKVEVYVTPSGGNESLIVQAESFLGQASYGSSRADIAAIFGGQFDASGYSFTVPGQPVGQYAFRVVSTSTTSTTPQKSVTVNVTIATAPAPTVTIATPTDGATVTTPLVVSGSAQVAAGVTSVQLVVDGSTSGSVQNCNNQTICSFNFSLATLAKGTHTVGAKAVGSLNTTATKTVGVYVGQIEGNLEGPGANSVQSGNFTISGWTLDTRAASGTGVTKVDIGVYPLTNGVLGAPVLQQTATYGGSRGDIGSIFGSQFTNSAFTLSATNIADGTYRAVAVATSSVNGTKIMQADFSVSRPTGNLVGSLDSPANGSNPGKNFTIGGWMIDKAATADSGVSKVDFGVFNLVNGNLGAAVLLGTTTYGGSRPDIGAVFGGNFVNSGFTTSVTNLPDGTYRVLAVATSSFDGKTLVKQSDITVAGPQGALVGNLESPSSTANTNFQISGWMIDKAATANSGISKVDFGVFNLVNGNLGSAVALGTTTYGGSRPDIAGVFGPQFNNSGFTASATNLAFGTYRVIAIGYSSIDGKTLVKQVDITIAAPVSAVKLFLDGPTEGATVTQPFNNTGWAIDTGAPSGIGIDAVHIWAIQVVNGVAGTAKFVDAATIGASRPDVGAFFGSQFTNSGFSFLMTGLTPGNYMLIFYPHSTVTGNFDASNSKSVNIIVK